MMKVWFLNKEIPFVVRMIIIPLLILWFVYTTLLTFKPSIIGVGEADNSILKVAVVFLGFMMVVILMFIIWYRFVRRTNSERGYISIELTEKLKDLFIDSLRAFENYSKLSGYEVKFSFDNSKKDRLGFKFTVTENPNNLSNDEIRTDIKEFLEKIQRGEEIKDIPVLINEVEHYKVLTILNNKLSTLRHNAYLEKNLNSGIEQIIEKVIEKKGFSQSIHIYNHQDNMNNSKKIDSESSNINVGDNNFIEDNSINIEHSFNEKKTIVEKIEYSIQQIDNEGALNPQQKQDLKRHLENIKEEITEEANPDTSKLKKSWDKIKKVAENLVLSKELTDALEWIGGMFNF